MNTARSAGHGTNRRASLTPGRTALLAALVLAAGCAAHGAPAMAGALVDDGGPVCEDFARGEVRRLGESVPAALAKGFLAGLAVDLTRIAEAATLGTGNAWEAAYWATGDGVPIDSESIERYRRAAPMVRAGTASFPASLIGGPQLAHDAARTNEDVHRQAVEKCLAPARLARQFGARDARVATSLELLADAYMRQREYAKAEPLRREAAAIWTTLFGPTDSTVARALDDHAAALRGIRRNAEADSLTARAVEIRAQLAALKARRPANAPRPSIEHSCDSPVNATLFTVCRPAPPGPDGPIRLAKP